MLTARVQDRLRARLGKLLVGAGVGRAAELTVLDAGKEDETILDHPKVIELAAFGEKKKVALGI